MLYQLFELNRDPLLRETTFGSSQLIGYDFNRLCREYGRHSRDEVDPFFIPNDPRGWDGMMNLGLTVTFEGAARQLPLYKSVEVWTNLEKKRASSKPIILERLFYKTDKGLVPYCWKQIDRLFLASTVVHCENLEQIHGELQGLSGLISVQDPRRLYAESLIEHKIWIPDERIDILLGIARSGRQYNRNFSRHVFSAETVKSTIHRLADVMSISPMDQNYGLNANSAYFEFVNPDVCLDPLTKRFPIGEIPISQMMAFATRAPIDVSIPPPLPILHPEALVTQTPICRILAEALDRVKLTDYSIKIRLVNGSVLSHRMEYTINRYLTVFDNPKNRINDLDVAILCDAARLAWRHAALSPNTLPTDTQDIDFFDEMDVTIVKTFAEEALVTLSHKNKTICVWHIDFATQAFCSMGLAIDSPTFKTETGVNRF